ncbi:hypothetical protein Pyrfu_1981 [Pyrolobus fumarii 1A]|uniref:Uncharacterized protein n=1 Tax=Pyrolobus fumarii (strain DSM 11204 / 1A) TaxID=694429 RepID=G0EDN0_PYRF1|nr:hypothetical protein [Pyrolobus fumarii]AEM39834.1 hypothetical protein Pyrfu_1981 [Pyrolobus fumarii 1A]
MAEEKKVTYQIILRKRARGAEVVYRRNGEALLHMGGRSAEKIFRVLTEELEKLGVAKPASKTEVEESYEIAPEHGTTVAAYLLLVRRSRNPDKWIPTLREIVEGKYPGLPQALGRVIDAAIEASKYTPLKPKRINTVIAPKIADAFSAGLKRLVEKMVKMYKQAAQK